MNQSESPWQHMAGRASTLQACLGHTVQGSLVQKSQLPRHSDAGLRPPSVCIFSLFSLGNEALANLVCVCLCIHESGFPVTHEPAGQFLPDLTKGQRTQGELNSYSAVQNTAHNSMQSQSLCLAPQQSV